MDFKQLVAIAVKKKTEVHPNQVVSSTISVISQECNPFVLGGLDLYGIDMQVFAFNSHIRFHLEIAAKAGPAFGEAVNHPLVDEMYHEAF